MEISQVPGEQERIPLRRAEVLALCVQGIITLNVTTKHSMSDGGWQEINMQRYGQSKSLALYMLAEFSR